MPDDDFKDLTPRYSDQPTYRARRQRRSKVPLVLCVVAGLGLLLGAATWLIVSGISTPSKLGRGPVDPRAAEFRERMRVFVDDAGSLVRAFEDRAVLKLLNDKLVALGETLSRVPDPPQGGDKIREKAKRVNDLLYSALEWTRIAIKAQSSGVAESSKKAEDGLKADLGKARMELAQIENMLR
jgi:hypothetical protein